jgi:2-polyprenyl-3-methyl-5-hydroxy-6-metoxy-1,4-benzoquinol methylase
MQYDPIKRKLGKVFNRTPFMRKLFYRLLDLLLLRSWHINKELNKWARSNKAQRQVLDAGSGFGQYVFRMARKNPQWQITGLDVKEEQIEDCSNFFQKAGLSNARFEVADLTRLRYVDRFDLVLCVDVMEHIEADVLVLANYNKALKPGGMLLISTPSDQGGSDVHQHDTKPEGAVGFIDEHVRDGYGVNELHAKLKKAGFSTSEIRYQYGVPGRLSWKLSMKYPILLLNTSKIFFVLLPFYYLLVFPFSLMLNLLDLLLSHKTGTGLIAKAWK